MALDIAHRGLHGCFRRPFTVPRLFTACVQPVTLFRQSLSCHLLTVYDLTTGHYCSHFFLYCLFTVCHCLWNVYCTIAVYGHSIAYQCCNGCLRPKHYLLLSPRLTVACLMIATVFTVVSGLFTACHYPQCYVWLGCCCRCPYGFLQA